MRIKELQDSDVEIFRAGIEYIFELYQDFVGVYYLLEKDGKDILLHQMDNVFTVIDVINVDELQVFSFYIDENYDLAGVDYDQFEYHIKDGEHLFINKETKDSASIALVPRTDGVDVDGYDGYVRYIQYNNESKDRLALTFQHMTNWQNKIYRYHTKNPLQVILYRKFVIGKNGKASYKSRKSYVAGEYDIYTDEHSYNMATIIDYGLKAFLEKGAYELQKNEKKITRYYKVLFTTPGQYAFTGFPLCEQYNVEQMRQFVIDNGFDYEIPQVYIDIYNKDDDIYKEASAVVEVYKAMMKHNEEVLKLSKRGDNNAN